MRAFGPLSKVSKVKLTQMLVQNKTHTKKSGFLHMTHAMVDRLQFNESSMRNLFFRQLSFNDFSLRQRSARNCTSTLCYCNSMQVHVTTTGGMIVPFRRDLTGTFLAVYLAECICSAVSLHL